MTPSTDNGFHARQRPPGRSLRVVVVDDNRDLVLTTMLLLRNEGHETKACYSGSDALECVREFDATSWFWTLAFPA
jgi:CheY-like chemotaxis protein